jgi:hypothetical protein
MSKTLMLAAVLLLSAAWLQAQSSSQAGSRASGQTTSPAASSQGGMSTSGQTSSRTISSQSSSSAAGQTIEGCLQGSSGNFTLTDSAGTTYQLSGDTSKLNKHVGEEVEVTGSPSGSSASNSSPGANSSAGTSASAGSSTSAGTAAGSSQQFTVDKVKKVSSTCKTAGK